jgi:acylaminoacyl-peptidase
MEIANDVSSKLKSLTLITSLIDFGVLFSKDSLVLGMHSEDVTKSAVRSYKKFINSNFPFPTCKSFSFNQSRSLLLCFQEESPEDLTLELWSSSRLLQVLPLKKTHSVLTSSSPFGKPFWSHDDKFFIYSAEAIPIKSSHFWTGEENSGNQHWFKENFGEGLKHVIDPQLFLYSIEKNQVILFKTPENIWPAQAIFRPGTDEVYFIGFEKFDFKLGLSGMINRKSKMFKRRVDGEVEEVEEIDGFFGFMAVLFPKFSPNGQFLSCFAVPEGSLAHVMCVSLVVKDLQTNLIKELVPRVFEFNSEFNGIYGYHETLETYDWLDDSTLIFPSPHMCSDCLFSVDLNGSLNEIKLPTSKPFSCAILDILKKTLLLKVSSFNNPGQVFILNKSNSMIPTLIEDCSHKPLTHSDLLLNPNQNQFKTTIIPSETSKIQHILHYNSNITAIVALIHGGPHSSGISGFSLLTSLLSLCNLAVLIINYSGSLGFGEDSLESLLGRVGELDLEDCRQAINSAKIITGCSEVVSYGRSHGGFLSLHLACAEKLKAAVTVNGVHDLASMALTSNIPEWGFAEVFRCGFQLPLHPECLEQACWPSGSFKAGMVDCPVLIAVGDKDCCVLPQISYGLFKVIRGFRRDVEMVVYQNEGHDFEVKENVYDFIVKSVCWILGKLKWDN